MTPEDQRPNPVEDYMRKIIGDSPKPEDKIKIPGANSQSASPRTQPEQSPITEKAFEQRRPVFDPTGRVENILPTETKVADVRRHPFGLIIIYAQFIIAMILSIGLIGFFLPSLVGADSEGGNLFIGLLLMVMSVFGLIYLVLATRIYKGNQLIITDMNVTQVHQVGLFNRKVSELTMANIEDVTVNVSGIFGTIFNFGTIVVETAGEQNNFIFNYCPNPNAYAKALQDARSSFMTRSGGGH